MTTATATASSLPLPPTRRVTVGDTVRILLPWSEVCMWLRIADQIRDVKILASGAQVLDDDGRPYSTPITHGEAGIHHDHDGLYLPPETHPDWR